MWSYIFSKNHRRVPISVGGNQQVQLGLGALWPQHQGIYKVEYNMTSWN